MPARFCTSFASALAGGGVGLSKSFVSRVLQTLHSRFAAAGFVRVKSGILSLSLNSQTNGWVGHSCRTARLSKCFMEAEAFVAAKLRNTQDHIDLAAHTYRAFAERFCTSLDRIVSEAGRPDSANR